MVFPLLPKHYLELASFPKRIPYPVVPWQQEKKQSSKTNMSQMISRHPSSTNLTGFTLSANHENQNYSKTFLSFRCWQLWSICRKVSSLQESVPLLGLSLLGLEGWYSLSIAVSVKRAKLYRDKRTGNLKLKVPLPTTILLWTKRQQKSRKGPPKMSGISPG